MGHDWFQIKNTMNYFCYKCIHVTFRFYRLLKTNKPKVLEVLLLQSIPFLLNICSMKNNNKLKVKMLEIKLYLLEFYKQIWIKYSDETNYLSSGIESHSQRPTFTWNGNWEKRPAAMIATKRSAGVTPELNTRNWMCTGGWESTLVKRWTLNFAISGNLDYHIDLKPTPSKEQIHCRSLWRIGSWNLFSKIIAIVLWSNIH